MPAFDHLFQPIQLGPTAIANRIFNPPHGTTLGAGGKVSDKLIAYHEARARGGVGLIIIEGMTIHPSHHYQGAYVYAGDDGVVPGLAALRRACRAHGVPVFGQLFHAGRGVRTSADGSRPRTYSASDIPDERYRVVPVAMSNAMVWEIIDAYHQAARRLAEADLDGVEILASMGYLVSQFLNPYSNRRSDEFGGGFEARLKLLREVLSGTRRIIGPGKTLGVRVSLSEMTANGMTPEDMLAICRAIDADGDVDYFSVISGSSASPAGWIHVFPPMAVEAGYVATDAHRLKQAVSRPVLVAGRINQPQIAEAILAGGQADMVGMARALIADPQFPAKARTGRADDIRACIACNQACVGHRLALYGISCIQNPVTGRELELGDLKPASPARSVMVVGGGPGGMKAAAVAASRGHRVSLHERHDQLGGQAILAQALPGRAEFGGVITNLVREMELAGVEVVKGHAVDVAAVRKARPDVVVMATGARARLPEAEIGEAHVVDSWSVIRGEANVGARVVIADWACDWSGLGLAEMLARNGCHVRLLSGGIVAGESIQGIVRDQWIGELHKLGVEMIPYARFYGADGSTAYFQHLTGGAPIICEDVDTVVTCFAPQAETTLMEGLGDFPGEVIVIGDAAAPRTVEEAVLEGFTAAARI